MKIGLNDKTTIIQTFNKIKQRINSTMKLFTDIYQDKIMPKYIKLTINLI